MRWCSGSGVLVHLFAIRPKTSSPLVPFYRLFPYHSAPPPPPSLFLAPGPPRVDPLPPQGPAPSGVSNMDPLPGTASVEVAVGSGAASVGADSGDAERGGDESEGDRSGGAEPGGAETGGAEPEGVEPGGAEPKGVEPGGAESGGAERRGTVSSAGPAGALPRLSPRPEPLSLQQLREWFAQRTRLRSGAAGAGDSAAGDIGAGGAGVTAGAGGTGGAAAAGPGGARTRELLGLEELEIEALAREALKLEELELWTVELESQPQLQPASPLPAPSPCTEQTGGHIERREPASRPASLVCTGRRVPCLRPPPVPDIHAMALRPSSVLMRVSLPPPPESSLPAVPDPESERARAASPTVSGLLATVITDPFFESTAASALVAELVDFAAACCLDYATALVVGSESVGPPSVKGECALGTDILEDRQEEFECLVAAVPRFTSMLLAPEGDPDAPDIPTPRSYAEAITSPYSSQWQAAMDAKMASWKSTGTYVDALPPSRATIVDGMWIFRVKRPSGSSPAFKARYVARGFSQRQGVGYFQTFSPTPKMTTLRVLPHVAAQHDYELHSLDFSTAFLQGSLHEEIWLRRPPGFTGSFPAGTQWSLRRPVYGLRQAPHEWHDTVRTTLAALGFSPSTADPSLFLHTDTSLPPFYVLVYITRDRAQRTITLTKSHMVHHVLERFGFQFSLPQSTPLSTGHSLSTSPSIESVEPSGPYPELVGCLMYLMTGHF
ncbi:unnamed protein product [Closterium sp. NIES-53]